MPQHAIAEQIPPLDLLDNRPFWEFRMWDVDERFVEFDVEWLALFCFEGTDTVFFVETMRFRCDHLQSAEHGLVIARLLACLDGCVEIIEQFDKPREEPFGRIEHNLLLLALGPFAEVIHFRQRANILFPKLIALLHRSAKLLFERSQFFHQELLLACSMIGLR